MSPPRKASFVLADGILNNPTEGDVAKDVGSESGRKTRIWPAIWRMFLLGLFRITSSFVALIILRPTTWDT